jgi:ABC-type uncharacterized transport system permease subunit
MAEKKGLKRYLVLTKAGIMEAFMFRTSLFLNIIGNLAYMVVMYFLWRAIFASRGEASVNGMTFEDTLVYLSMAGAIFSSLEVFLVWKMGREIQSGEFALHFTKPLDYFFREFFYIAGNVILQTFTTLLPTFIVVGCLTGWKIPLGLNLLFFPVAFFFALLLNFSIDFIVGTMCLYTQSFWGINIVKEVIISVMSGAAVPLAFFPEVFRNIAMYLPFQAIYNLPLQILISRSMTPLDYVKAIGIQAGWFLALMLIGRIFFQRSSKIITVNGG